jgi:malate dehydrogenase (oxaloacetate-decarboxylating)
VRGPEDFAIWYTPGVAAPCREIAASPERVFDHTNRGNLVAIVSDGTRVLGLGDIGPEAGLPVMEGKALLFKLLGGVDALPLCIGTKDPDEIVRVVECLAPSFGGVNLEDIAQPKCFQVLDRLRERLPIPVWHDDQQGTATVVVAALENALAVVGKRLERARIAMIGFGAANVAVYRLLRARGADPSGIVACDRRGTLHRERADLGAERERFADKWRACCDTNPEPVRGGIAETLRGADVCIAFSEPGPGVIAPDWIRGMGGRRDRAGLREPDSRDLALGRARGGRRHRGERAQRSPEPGEQLARLPRHLPRHARRARALDQRRHGARRGRRAGARGARGGALR